MAAWSSAHQGARGLRWSSRIEGSTERRGYLGGGRCLRGGRRRRKTAGLREPVQICILSTMGLLDHASHLHLFLVDLPDGSNREINLRLHLVQALHLLGELHVEAIKPCTDPVDACDLFTNLLEGG